MVNNDSVHWLLEEDNPAVRYAALTGLLGRPSDDPEVQHAQQLLMKTDPVGTIPMQLKDQRLVPPVVKGAAFST